MRSLRSVCLAGVVGSVVALASPAYAQQSASVEGFVGYYRPFGHYEPASAYPIGLPTRPSDLRAPMLGISGRMGITPRLGVAAQIATGRSQSGPFLTPGGPIDAISASTIVGSLVGQYDVTTSPARYHLRLNVGPAFVRHGGDAYKSAGASTSFAPALGTSLAVPMGAHLQLSAEATGMFYSTNIPMPAELRGNPGPLQRGRQRDLLLHLGVAWTPS